MEPPPDFDRLRALSARIGADPLLVQAAGGNTSFKIADILWIKASGTWLRDAAAKPIFVPVGLVGLRDAIARGVAAADSARDFVADGGALRPSIETSLHAVLPHRVVVHVHCVETIAWACLPAAREEMATRLAEHRWAFVPYVRPGLPLAHAVTAASDADVFILGNHGLVVAADTVDEAERLLASVRTALRRAPRPEPPEDAAVLEAEASRLGYRLPRHAAAHAVATDPLRLERACGGSLYPDHVIFLGRGATRTDHPENRPPPPMLLVTGAGVLLARDAPPAADEMARCLAEVTGRFGPADHPVYLTASDEDGLLNWDAEHYRRTLQAR